MRPFFSYMLLCSDGTYYVGQTDDLDVRIAEHDAGAGCRYTNARLPVTLVWFAEFASRDDAKAAEARIKGWNRAKKQALIDGRFDVISQIPSRSRNGRALRDALLRKAPQGRGEK